MAFVKADFDKQRAEQNRIDAEDDFIARLDARMAAEEEEESSPTILWQLCEM